MAKGQTSQPSDLAASIRAAIPSGRPGTTSWFQRIPREVLAELEAIRQEFRDGKLAGTKTGLARTISNELLARGLSNIGPQGVIEWLKSG